MALVPCKECKKEVSDSAMECPHCGSSYHPEHVRVWAEALLEFAVLVLVFSALDGLFLWIGPDLLARGELRKVDAEAVRRNILVMLVCSICVSCIAFGAGLGLSVRQEFPLGAWLWSAISFLFFGGLVVVHLTI